MPRDAVITKVAALLAKADRTEHIPEREAFLAKAQAMITRHQIAEEELATTPGAVQERTVEIEGWGNATRGVVYLYSGIAELNRCSVGHRTSRGRARLVLFGTETDATLTCALVDHLLPQLRLAILADRPRSRMSYAIGWSHEVLARLSEASASAAAASNALVPTNARADEALRAAHRLKTERRSLVDAVAYGSGISAAADVDLGRVRVDGPGPAAPAPSLGPDGAG
ncbi:MAG: DUF2786 domain-containing protein [Actinomycetota bacterium]